jgi:hypothetical protein
MFSLPSKILASRPASSRIPGLIAMLFVSAVAVAGEVRREDSVPVLDVTQADSLFTPAEHRQGVMGHPSTALLCDGKTRLVYHPDGHYRGDR